VLDYTQYHQYADGGNRISIPDFAGWLSTSIPAMTEKFKRPCITGEFGPSYMGANVQPYVDNAGWSIHNEAWGSLVTGSGGSGFTWWWDNWVQPKNLYYRFKGIGMFMQGQNLGGMTPTKLSASDGNLRAMALTGNSGSLVWVQSKQHTWWKIRNGEWQVNLGQSSVQVPCASSVRYTVQVWDTVDGYAKTTNTFTCSGNSYTVSLPSFNNDRGDWALKVFPIGQNNITITAPPTYNTQSPVPTPTTNEPQPTSGGKGKWEFCTQSSECANGCCSKEYSGDGQFKCTPGGTQCKKLATKGNWEFCSSSAECLNGCCSNQYSGDGKNKCTPDGTKCL